MTSRRADRPTGRTRLRITGAIGVPLLAFSLVVGLYAAGGPGSVRHARLTAGHHGRAVPADGATAYVACESANVVVPFDTATGVQGAPIQVGASPDDIVVDTSGTTAYVSDYGGAYTPTYSVTVITLATSATQEIALHARAVGLVLSPDGTRLYVADNAGAGGQQAQVSVIATSTDTLVSTISLSGPPVSALALTPNGSKLYVVQTAHPVSGSSTVTPIATATGTLGSPIKVGTDATAIAITPDGTTALVVNVGGGNDSPFSSITPITLATGTTGAALSSGTGFSSIAITPNGATAYAGGLGQVTPVTIAGLKVGAHFTVGGGGLATGGGGPPPGSTEVAAASGSATVYVLNQNDGPGSISVVATASDTVTATFGWFPSPAAMAVAP